MTGPHAGDDGKQPPAEELLQDLEPGEEAEAEVKGGCMVMSGPAPKPGPTGPPPTSGGGGSAPTGPTPTNSGGRIYSA